MNKRLSLFAFVVALVIASLGAAGVDDAEFTSDFGLKDCHFVPHGGNAYFSLRPRHTLWLAGEDDGEFVEVRIKVLRRVRAICFEADGRHKLAMTRVIEEREWIDGELVEVSLNYFARCRKTGNIFYFGEDVDIYEDGEIVSHDGAWLAGEDGAQPGLIMPDLFLLGARYFQEVAPGIALDRAEHVEMGLSIVTPAGVFEDCVKIIETTPLEPGEESVKIYAPGVGLIVDDVVELVDYR